jgi:hypothetical protein
MKLALVLAAALCSAAAFAANRAPTRNQTYAAIAYHPDSNSVGWASDRKSAREAKVDALRQCNNEKCEVVASITRGCGALAKTAKKFSVQKGATREEAQAKALKQCGAGCEVLAWACSR